MCEFQIPRFIGLKVGIFRISPIGHLKISRTWTAEMEMDKLSRDYLMRDT